MKFVKCHYSLGFPVTLSKYADESSLTFTFMSCQFSKIVSFYGSINWKGVYVLVDIPLKAVS